MHLDFSLITDTSFETDICIIGSGAAGYACAVSLLESGLRVLLVESGRPKPDEEITKLHLGEVSNQPHTGIHEGRARVVGGTTTKWGGQALPFMAEDFQYRPYVQESGWPIGASELAPYYQKAERILGTDPAVPFSYQPWQDWGVTPPAFSANTLDLLVTKWCKIPDFAQQHGDKVQQSATVHLLHNASVTELVPTADATAVRVVNIRSIEGKTGGIRARYVIAATGAIETVRLFLNSTEFGANGLGNDYSLVGKYFQDHVSAVVGQVLPTSRKRLHAIFDPFYRNGFKYLPRLRFSPVLAQELRLLHASAQVLFPTEARSPLAVGKQLISTLRRKQLPSLTDLKALASPRLLLTMAKALARWKLGKRGSLAGAGPIWLEVHSEQEPQADSYITLSTSTDAMRMPRAKLHWTIADSTITTIQTVAKLLQTEFEQAGLGTVVLVPWLTEGTDNPRRWLADTFHQTGGLRMATSESKGVVDATCKVFGVDNLYVASSAVFPTSSFSNPTMTIIALAIRISEEIAQRLQAENNPPARLVKREPVSA
jgi:2-polyprenyl-6-methoxyphenol hydroxylase-like FAD-dependent oxidoreductase